MARYMVGLHDDVDILDEEAIAISIETILDDIAQHCDRRIRSEYADTER